MLASVINLLSSQNPFKCLSRSAAPCFGLSCYIASLVDEWKLRRQHWWIYNGGRGEAEFGGKNNCPTNVTLPTTNPTRSCLGSNPSFNGKGPAPPPTRPRHYSVLFLKTESVYLSFNPPIIHTAISLSKAPQPFPKQVRHTVRSCVSSFSFHHPLSSLRFSSSCLRHLPRLPVTSIFPYIFLQ